MKRALAVFGTVMFLMATLSGCITTSSSQQNQQEIAQLKSQIAGLEQKQADLESRLAGISEKSAEAYLAMDEMRQQVSSMQGRFEQSGFEAKKYSKETEGLRNYMGAQLSILDKRIAVAEKKLNITNSQSLEKLPPSGGAAAPIDSGGGKKNADDLYKEAYNAYMATNLEKAKAQFREFLKQHPKHAKASYARFYLADSFYKQKDYENAILEFDRVTADYPGSQLAPAAYLNLGLSFESMGSTADARLFYEKVVADYPGTKEAQIAKKKLQLLK